MHAVAWSRDGARVAAAGDAPVQLWEATTGKLLHRLAAHRGSIGCLSFSHDGEYVAAGTTSPEGDVLVWDLGEPQGLRTFYDPPSSSYVGRVDFHPTRPWLVSSHRDGRVRVWDVATGQQTAEHLACGVACWCAAWSPDGEHLLAGGGYPGYTLRIWDRQGRFVKELPRRKTEIRCAAWTADGKRIIVGGSDHDMQVCDFDTLETVASLKAARCPGHHRCLLHRREGSSRWRAGTRSSAGRWPRSSPPPSWRRPPWYGGWRGVRMGTGSPPREQGRGACLGHDDPGTGKDLERPRGCGEGLAWSPDGRELASYDARGVLLVRDFETGALRLRLTTQSLGNRVHADLEWSPDGRWLATVQEESAVEVWDAATGERLLHFDLPGPALAVSADSRWLAFGFTQGDVAPGRRGAQAGAVAAPRRDHLRRRLEPAGRSPRGGQPPGTH